MDRIIVFGVLWSFAVPVHCVEEVILLLSTLHPPLHPPPTIVPTPSQPVGMTR